jgi:hypothetical protein
MSDPTTGLRDAIESLLQRGERARDTIRPAETREAGVPAIASDDWSVSRRIVYDQPLVNRWKTDLLRFLRTHYHEGDAATSDAADPYTEMHAIIDRAGVLWRAVEPGLDLLRRLQADSESSA